MPLAFRCRASAAASVALTVACLTIPAAAQSLHDYIEAAASRSPELAALQARREAIGARQQAADAALPGAPTLNGSYLTDQATGNRNQREAQLGVSTPIWLPGEGTASRRLADAELARSAPAAAMLRLRVAGQVREALAEFALAQAETRVAERRLRDARQQESDMARRTRARDASEADLLLARADRIAAEADLHDRRSTLEQTRLDFQALVGMTPAAAALTESPPPGAGGVHPRLEDAKGAMDIARANQALVGLQVRDSPEIGVIARRNRDIGGSVYDNSIGVEVRIPFATQARNGPKRAAAQAELTEASVGFAAAERDIGAEQQKARVAYDNAVAQQGLARERAKALAQHSALVGRGQAGGEVSLTDAIRARTQAYEAEAAAARATIAVARAIGRLNQAYGVAP